MNDFLSFIANEEVFVDPVNHGGGLHQGRRTVFLICILILIIILYRKAGTVT
jgi:hypothetical protein